MISTIAKKTLSSRALLRQLPRVNAAGPSPMRFTTYSGGQPSEGQGGFYGSIKSRSESPKFSPGARAEATDLTQLTQLMQAWESKKAELTSAEDQKKALQQLASEKTNAELIDRLVIKGAPVWGLSVEQREFVVKLQDSK